MHVLVPMAEGCEEIETATIIDTLRRAGARVCTAALTANPYVRGSRGLVLGADSSLNTLPDRAWDLIALPGGMPGAEHLSQSEQLKALLLAQQQAGRPLAAICAAPAVVLGRQGLLAGYSATGHPAFREELGRYAARLVDERVCVDGLLTTSQGPGTALEFALTLVAQLYGSAHARTVAEPMLPNFSL